LSRVGREIRRKTPSCSLRGEEGCSHSTAVGGKRASSFRSLTPFYRRYSLWPPPQPAPLSRPPVPARVSKHPSLVPIEKDVYLQAMVQPCLTPFRYCPTPPSPRKHPSQVPIEQVGRGLASDGAVPALSFPALPPFAPPSRGGAWKQQRATGTESAERRGNRAASPATLPGVAGVGTRFLRTGCTVLWQVSQKLVRSEFRKPRPFPFGGHGGTVSAGVAGIKYFTVAEKRELRVKKRYSCSSSTPVIY